MAAYVLPAGLALILFFMATFTDRLWLCTRKSPWALAKDPDGILSKCVLLGPQCCRYEITSLQNLSARVKDLVFEQHMSKADARRLERQVRNTGLPTHALPRSPREMDRIVSCILFLDRRVGPGYLRGHFTGFDALTVEDAAEVERRVYKLQSLERRTSRKGRSGAA